MCNLYTMTRAQEAMRQLFAPISYLDRLGNLPSLTEIYPDYPAPVLRNSPDGPEMVMCRWGMPTPANFLIGKKTDRGVTNIRNTASRHWQRWLDKTYRCLVPLTAFAEPDGINGGNVWFSLPDNRPAFFAGLQVPQWTSVRKVKDGATTDDLFAVLTTQANSEVAAVHPKAMPVILTNPVDWHIFAARPGAGAPVTFGSRLEHATNTSGILAGTVTPTEMLGPRTGQHTTSAPCKPLTVTQLRILRARPDDRLSEGLPPDVLPVFSPQGQSVAATAASPAR